MLQFIVSHFVKYIVEKYFKKFNVAQTSYLECLLGGVCQWVFLMQKYKKRTTAE